MLATTKDDWPAPLPAVRQPKFGEDMFSPEHMEFITRNIDKEEGIRILILFSASSNERMAVKHICNMNKWPVDVMSVDMKPAEDGATLEPDTDIAERCGLHMQVEIDMNDMTGEKGSAQLMSIVKDYKPNCIIAHPDCTYWSCVGNGTYAKGRPRYAEAKAKQHRNIKSILDILNYPAQFDHTCAVLLENPQGKLNTRISLEDPDTMTDRECMDHTHTYTNDLVSKMYKTKLLRKKTTYTSGGLSAAINQAPLISEPSMTHFFRLKKVETCATSAERSETPKTVAFVTASTIILRYCLAKYYIERAKNQSPCPVHPVVQKWKDNKDDERRLRYNGVDRPEVPPTSKTNEYSAEYWCDGENGTMTKLSGSFRKYSTKHQSCKPDVTSNGEHRHKCKCVLCAMTRGTKTVFDAGKMQAISYVNTKTHKTLTFRKKRNFDDMNEVYEKHAGQFMTVEETDFEHIAKCKAAEQRAIANGTGKNSSRRRNVSTSPRKEISQS